MKWEDLEPEEIFEIAYHGEMAKVLLTALELKEDYEKFKKEKVDLLKKIKEDE